MTSDKGKVSRQQHFGRQNSFASGAICSCTMAHSYVYSLSAERVCSSKSEKCLLLAKQDQIVMQMNQMRLNNTDLPREIKSHCL